MRRVLLIATLGSLACVSTSARADDYPPRKPGLWEITMNLASAHAPPMVSKMCIDTATDAALYKIGSDAPGIQCSRRDIVRSGQTMTIDSVCNMGNRTFTTHAITVFTDDVAYHTDNTSHIDPPLTPGQAETKTSQDAKWVGPCPADMKPGDMMLPNGVKMNILSKMGGGK